MHLRTGPHLGSRNDACILNELLDQEYLWTSLQADESRIVTKVRWVIGAVFVHLRTNFSDNIDNFS